MAVKPVELVLDCDGVLTDIWRPSQRVLRGYSDEKLSQFVDEQDDLDRLKSFAKSFDFARDTIDFEFSNLTPAQKALVCTTWNEGVFLNPDYLFDYSGEKCLNWESFRLGELTDNQTDWLEIGKWLNSLTAKCNITIHTHLDPRFAAYRQQWFDDNILSSIDNKSRVSLFCDTGTLKQQLRGDIVVEDRLYNILNAEADLKILRGQFHNCYSPYNLRIWRSFDTNLPEQPKRNLTCVSNFNDMQAAIQDYLDRR